MALPRKGSRKITVEGHALRWLARRRAEAYELMVERAAEPGQRLTCAIPLALFPADARILSPELVRQCVTLGLTAGFDPDAPRGQRRLAIAAGQLDFGRVNREALKPRPVGRPRKRAPGEKRRPVYVSLEPPDRARLETIAAARGVGLGTLARAWILERLAEEEAG